MCVSSREDLCSFSSSFISILKRAGPERERGRRRKATNSPKWELSAIWKKSHSLLKGSNCHHHKIKLYRDDKRRRYLPFHSRKKGNSSSSTESIMYICDYIVEVERRVHTSSQSSSQIVYYVYLYNIFRF